MLGKENCGAGFAAHAEKVMVINSSSVNNLDTVISYSFDAEKIFDIPMKQFNLRQINSQNRVLNDWYGLFNRTCAGKSNIDNFR